MQKGKREMHATRGDYYFNLQMGAPVDHTRENRSHWNGISICHKAVALPFEFEITNKRAYKTNNDKRRRGGFFGLKIRTHKIVTYFEWRGEICHGELGNLGINWTFLMKDIRISKLKTCVFKRTSLECPLHSLEDPQTPSHLLACMPSWWPVHLFISPRMYHAHTSHTHFLSHVHTHIVFMQMCLAHYHIYTQILLDTPVLLKPYISVWKYS